MFHIWHLLHHDRVLDLILRISDRKLVLDLTVVPDIEFNLVRVSLLITSR